MSDCQYIWTRMAKAFETTAKGIMDHAGISLEGSDIPSLANYFAEVIKSIGLCQRVNILEATDNKLVVDIGECAFAPATKAVANDDPNFIPPCPMLAMLVDAIDNAINKKLCITSRVYKPAENTSIFTLSSER